VLRYCFEPNARPLWPQATRLPGPNDIPPCARCGAPRQFEFQVLPQLLHFLDIDIDPDAERVDKSLDWCARALPSSISVILLFRIKQICFGIYSVIQ
jgi:hypothetical protein